MLNSQNLFFLIMYANAFRNIRLKMKHVMKAIRRFREK